MEAELKNLTGKTISVFDVSGNKIDFQPEKVKAYIEVRRETQYELNGIRIVKNIKSEPIDMAPPTPGVKFIVSKMVGEALKKQGRFEDILIPDELMPASGGKIIGCKSLSMI